MINEESLDKISSDENSDTELTGDQCQAVKNNQRLFEYSLPTISNTRDCYQKPNITQKPIISRSPSSLFVNCYSKMANEVEIGTEKLQLIHSNFKRRVLEKIRSIREIQPVLEIRKEPQFHACSSCQEDYNDDSSSSNDSSSSSDDDCEDHKPIDITRQTNLTEIDRKRSHPCALHPDISFNEAGQVNDGPYCKCSWAAKQTGVRHNKFAGEKPFKVCDLNSNNIDHLYHYVLKIRPCPAEFSRQPSQLCIGGVKEPYIFEGFSVFFHRPLPDGFRKTPINKWNPEFEIELVDEKVPKGFTVGDLELFYTYLFENVLELYDLDRTLNASDELSCVYWHAMPRFVRRMPNGSVDILPMSAVLDSLAASFYPSITDDIALSFQADKESLRTYANKKKGMLFLNPAKKPMTIRADIIDSCDNRTDDFYPLLTHFGIRPSAYAYSGKPEYQRALKRFVKFRHLISLKARLSAEDKQTLAGYEERLRQLKAECKVKRDATISINSRGFFETGLYPDMVQHSMFLILSCFHVRFHWSLEEFEEKRIKYKFKDKAILELALTHPSYRANYGTNPDHAKNTLNNCGIRWTKAQTSETTDGKSGLGRKRGINALMEIMAKQSSNDGAKSAVKHNERLEFLGDAVVEFITTVHLFFVFQYLEEGGLATYRSSIVQNKHLAFLAKKIGLHEFMLYAHGPDLCHESDLRHAMANAFEALMAALLLDSDINECDRIFSETLFGDDPRLFKVWKNLAEHPLKKDNPYGDRHLIDTVPCLQLLTMFENNIGIRFKHIRLLAKAFTRRNVAFNYLTLGHNQRLEFLGDTVLQLITTEYLYKHFPHHQEGHLSLLRTCLVSNKTQSVICDDLAMQKYVVVPKAMKRRANYASTITLLRVKDKADLVEAFLGALYVDRGLEYCRTFCQVCFFPRLKHFILTQKWNDPKSQLQQCCLTLRQPTSGEPDIPEYKTIGVEGPTNTRVYRVAVYFRSKRLAEGVGGSVQLAQMQAAENALSENATLFPSFNLYAPSNNSDAPNSMQQQKQVRNDTFKAPSVKRRYTPDSTVREMNHTPRRNYKPSSSLSSYSSFTSRNIPRTSGTLFRIRSLSRESTPKSAHAKLSSLNRKKPILK